MFMDKMPLLFVVFYSIPESLLLFTFGYVIWGYKIKIRTIILAALISAWTSYFVRVLPIPFGVHSLIGIFVIFMLFTLICKFTIKQGFIASLISLSTIIALENSVLYLIQVLFKLKLQEIWVQPPLIRILLCYPQLLILALIILIIYKNKFSLGGTSNEPDNSKQIS